MIITILYFYFLITNKKMLLNSIFGYKFNPMLKYNVCSKSYINLIYSY